MKKRQVINATIERSSKIISSEEDENVRVTFETYKKLFKPGGSWYTIVFIQVSMCCFVFCNIASMYYI